MAYVFEVTNFLLGFDQCFLFIADLFIKNYMYSDVQVSLLHFSWSKLHELNISSAAILDYRILDYRIRSSKLRLSDRLAQIGHHLIIYSVCTQYFLESTNSSSHVQS